MSTKKSIVLLLIVSIVIYFRWLLPVIFTSSDWGYAPNSYLKLLLNIPYAWTALSSFGAVDILLWRYPINILYGITSLAGFDWTIADRFIVFWPTIFLGNISIFLLSKKITKSNLSSIIASFVFNYSTYNFISQTAFLLYAGATWAVIGLFFFIKSFEKKRLFFSLLTGISLFITGAYDFRVAYMASLIIFAYFLFYLLTNKHSVRSIALNIANLIVPFSIFVLLNLYWVFPLIMSEKLVSNVILTRGLFGNEFLNILYAITSSHPFWTGVVPTIFNPQPILFYFWLIPVVVFLGLFVNKNNKLVLFFGLLTFIGVFFTKQVGQPFAYIYTFLFQYLPGFSAFREASKFYFLISLGYSILIAGFVSWALYKFNLISWRRNIFLIVVSLLFLVNAIPFICGNLPMSKPRSVPNDYKTVDSFVLSKTDFSRTLWVPAYSRWGESTFLHPLVVGVDSISNTWSFLTNKKNNDETVTEGGLLMNLLDRNIAKNLLSVSSIKYVIVPLEDDKNDDNFFVFYGENRNFYISRLDKSPYLKKINVGTKDVVVYENPYSKPHIYITSQKETVYAYIPYQSTHFTFINPTQYTIELKNLSKPFYLNFSDSYNPNWKLRLGSFNWANALYDKNYFLPVSHFANDARLNSFYINPEKICLVSKDCIKNADGSYSMKLTLYFKSQSYLYLGVIISGITFLGVFGTVLFLGIKEIKIYGRKN